MANCGSGVAHIARPLLGKISSTSMPSRSWSASRPSGSAPALLRAWSSPSRVDSRSRSGRWPSLTRHCTPSLSVMTRGRRSRYLASMRSTQRLAGSLAWPSAETMKYLFAASGRALCGQREAPGVSRRQRLGSLTTIWLIVSSSSTSLRQSAADAAFSSRSSKSRSMLASTCWQAKSSAGGTLASRRAWISPPTLAARLARSRPGLVR